MRGGALASSHVARLAPESVEIGHVGLLNGSSVATLDRSVGPVNRRCGLRLQQGCCNRTNANAPGQSGATLTS